MTPTEIQNLKSRIDALEEIIRDRLPPEDRVWFDTRPALTPTPTPTANNDRVSRSGRILKIKNPNPACGPGGPARAVKMNDEKFKQQGSVPSLVDGKR